MSKALTDWSGNTTYGNATRLNSTSVALNSTAVTLLGYAVGTHYADNKQNTDWAGIAKNKSDWTGHAGVFTNSVLLNSLVVALNSLTVNLLTYTAGVHFFDNKNNTDWGSI